MPFRPASCVLRPALFFVSLFFVATTAQARPPKRFHEGPYLQLLTGTMQSAHDSNVRTGQGVGHDVEPAFGFIFGWNISDPFAVELVGRYATAKTFASPEHVMRMNAHLRWTWITNALTHFRSLRILPFLHGGPLAQLTILPGDPEAGSSTVSQWGGGASTGGGVSFLFHQYVYLSAAAQADMVRRNSVTQFVGGVPMTTYAGGWSVEWSAHAGLGVHF